MRSISWLLPTLLLWLAGCTRPEHRGARDYRDKLAEEIGKASFVEVIEHSQMADFPEEAFPEPTLRTSDDVPKIEYARIRLSREQKQGLLKRIRSFEKVESGAVSFCGFVPHHTIEFHSDSGVMSRLEICFACSGFWWEVADFQGSPEGWMREFRGFISEIGMRPETDWKDLALKSGKIPVRPEGVERKVERHLRFAEGILEDGFLKARETQFRDSADH